MAHEHKTPRDPIFVVRERIAFIRKRSPAILALACLGAFFTLVAGTALLGFMSGAALMFFVLSLIMITKKDFWIPFTLAVFFIIVAIYAIPSKGMYGGLKVEANLLKLDREKSTPINESLPNPGNDMLSKMRVTRQGIGNAFTRVREKAKGVLGGEKPKEAPKETPKEAPKEAGKGGGQ